MKTTALEKMLKAPPLAGRWLSLKADATQREQAAFARQLRRLALAGPVKLWLEDDDLLIAHEGNE